MSGSESEDTVRDLAGLSDEEVRQRQIKIAETLGIPVVRRHILLCADQTTPKCCDRERSLVAWTFLKKRLKELGLSEQGGVYRTKANCLRICEGGPVAVVYPEGAWYGRCDPPVLEEIIQEHLIGGRIAQEHCFAIHPFPAPDAQPVDRGTAPNPQRSAPSSDRPTDGSDRPDEQSTDSSIDHP